MPMPRFTAEAALTKSSGRYVQTRHEVARSGLRLAQVGCGSYCERNGEHCCCLPGERCVEFGSHCWCESANPHVLKPEPVWR
jgi:hypothetical protein